MDEKFYPVTLNGNEYGLPIVEIKPGLRIAVFDMLSSAALSLDASEALLKVMREKLADVLPSVDTVLSAETKGITLVNKVADALGKEMVVLRKEEKIYYPGSIKSVVNTYTTKGDHALYLPPAQIPKLEGKNVLIVDDVVSTGSSLSAIESILTQVKANIVGKAFVFAEGDAANRPDIVYVEKLPLL